MRKYEFVVLVIALLVLIISIAMEVNAQAGVMDEQLSQIQQQLETVQADYARAHGYYVQILPIHPEKAAPREEPFRVAPATLISPLAAPVRPAHCPADYAECPPVELPDRDISITVNVYVNAHLGPGYELVAEYTDDRGLWRRVINYGPEIERNREWYIVEDR